MSLPQSEIDALVAEAQQHPNWGMTLDFLETNAELYDSMIKMIEKAKALGRDKIGLKLIVEVLRWQSDIERGFSVEAETFRLNNRMTSCMARVIAADRPDLMDMLEFRPLTSAR